MANQIKPFALTVPPGTSASAPVTFNTDLGNYDVVSVSVRVPDGANGLVGFRFTSGGLAMIPASNNDWLVMSGEQIDWPLADVLDSGAWQVTAYNTGNYPHTLYVRYLLNIQTGANNALTAPAPLSVAAIQGTVDFTATAPPDLSS